MRVMVIGATGLIGAAVVARLVSQRVEVVGVARHVAEAARRQPRVTWLALDISRLGQADWAPHLAGVSAVVNCAGVLQDGPGDDVRAVHADAVVALSAACRQAGIRRFIQVSAAGTDHSVSEFSRTKAAAERVLAASELDWVILRPAVVIGRQAYGGSAMFRGLAALPLYPGVPGSGPLQVVDLDDVVATVIHFLHPVVPARLSLDLAAPGTHSLAGIVAAYRRWLGWSEAKALPLPRWLAAGLFRAGDLVSRLGWRPPMRANAWREIERGATGDPAEWMRLTGLRPRPLEAMLAAEPAGVQERWFAALYFVKPAVFIVLAIFWMATGAITLGPAFGAGVTLMEEGGAGHFGAITAATGGVADFLIGLGIAWRRTARPALYAALAVSLAYAVAGSLVLPRLWIDPLGPLVKIAPILVLHLAALGLLRDR